jgi:hypothetical protein
LLQRVFLEKEGPILVMIHYLGMFVFFVATVIYK